MTSLRMTPRPLKNRPVMLERIGGHNRVSSHEWVQTGGRGDALLVERLFRESNGPSDFDHLVTIYLKKEDSVIWSGVSLEDFFILLDENGNDPKIILLYRGGGGDSAFETLLLGLRGRFEVASDRAAGIQSILDELRGFVLLFATRKNLFPSREVQRGVFGELKVMSDLREAGHSYSDLLNAWVGPQGSHQDFIFGNRGMAIEVKSALALEAKVRISNEQQLDSIGFNCLFMAVVRVKEAPAGKGLAEVVDAIQSGMNKFEREIMEQLLEKLNLPKWLRELLPPYKLMVQPDSPLYFEINDDSPVLRRSELTNVISKVSYDLDYAMFPNGIDFADVIVKLTESHE
jgi:hypothetical protein